MKIKLHDDKNNRKSFLNPEKTPLYCAVGLIAVIVVVGVVIGINSSKGGNSAVANNPIGAPINPTATDGVSADGSATGTDTVVNPDGTVSTGTTVDGNQTTGQTTGQIGTDGTGTVSNSNSEGIVIDDGQGGTIEIIPDQSQGELSILPNTGTDSTDSSTTDTSGSGSAASGNDSSDDTDANESTGIIELPFVPASELSGN